MSRPKPTHDELMTHLANVARSTRDTADEIAAMFEGCDDPLYPWPIPNRFHDWLDFVEQVARPLVEAEGDNAAVQATMRLYRTVSPLYLCTALVMAANRVTDAEAGWGLAREAVDNFEDALPYAGEYLIAKWEYREDLAKYRAALDRHDHG